VAEGGWEKGTTEGLNLEQNQILVALWLWPQEGGGDLAAQRPKFRLTCFDGPGLCDEL